MHKSAKIDFFNVEISDSTDLETILGKLHALPADSEKRNEELNDDWVRLVRGKMSETGYLGDIMRISMAPAGFRANLAGAITAVNLNKDEGMAECSAFYYDFETSVLVLQRNGKGVSASQLSRYFKRIADVDGEVELKPVLRPTDIMKVKVLPVIRKIHIASSVVDMMTTMENLDERTRHTIQAAAQAESPSIEIILKSAREKDATLNQAIAIETIESWLRIHDELSDEENEVVKKVLVSGKDDSGATVEFDMLKDKMFTVMNYQWVPDDIELWQTRSGHIQKAWDLNKANLERIRLNKESRESEGQEEK
ncbi:DUF6731 family protein [Verrucomicrobiales bacterium BCK34]|nr:DUF6731 family protein [Verrucomicrobiales bacterium BCK34]